MRPIIYPYRMGSRSCKALAESLSDVRAKRVRADGNYRPFRNHLIVNWGMSTLPEWEEDPYLQRFETNWINHPEHIVDASNKLTAFEIMKSAGVSIPEFTIDSNVAIDWAQGGDLVVCRTVLNGHGGNGILLSEQHDKYPDSDMYRVTVPNAPLYVKYIKKSAEYRVHVFKGQIIDIQQKRKRRDLDNEMVDYQIRNHNNGWIFARDDIENPRDPVISNSLEAVRALGLDFGAVDVIWNDHYQKAFVLEINTAPGLEGTTLEKYSNAIRDLL